jgi:hypothetical protein
MAKTNFTQRVGTISDAGVEMELLGVVRATLRTTLRLPSDLRLPRLFVDLRFVAAKVARDYAELWKQKQDGTADCAI